MVSVVRGHYQSKSVVLAIYFTAGNFPAARHGKAVTARADLMSLNASALENLRIF